MEIVTAFFAAIWLLFALVALGFRNKNTASDELGAGSGAASKEKKQEPPELGTRSCSNKEQ